MTETAARPRPPIPTSVSEQAQQFLATYARSRDASPAGPLSAVGGRPSPGDDHQAPATLMR
jgi:hypothetical protein